MTIKNYDKILLSSYKKKITSITLTNSAFIQILHLIKKNPKIIGLRLNIKKNGCAGYSYKIEKIINFVKNDIVYENKNIKIKLYIPYNLVSFINGTKIDFIKNNINCAFVFYNKKIKKKCGCGKSFNLIH
ncbi:Protein sufA [Candidatus Westeberhardia cardiocondylae]|uniref:Protein sufA n=1 Tax=Candidatus Westeberhardia cardiocondylae TaxID=1594731 RepID=A0A0H5BWX0_9ENTR|nr:iron-sulfur cluster assembly accessory protein [Candidatus Westeberhardia cardiocondylae]CEN32212.1 Protein sufA [Candidatus Westeberhardia cardiocondylae]